MADKPILLFLHGVGTGDPGRAWQNQLEGTLERLGYPGLAEVEVVAPIYAHALKGADEHTDLPDVTAPALSKKDARAHRREFERRIGALEFRLGRLSAGKGWVGAAAVVDVALAMPVPVLKSVPNYLTKDEIRAQVLRRILDALPTSGRIVIVAHSLGSVIGADLLRHLPAELEVAGMVTIGSPLAHGSFDTAGLKSALADPPTNVEWWVNFWAPGDPVAAHRGLSSVFPWLLDFPVPSKPDLRVHNAVTYMAASIVGEAVGYGLFGSRSTDLVALDRTPDVEPDEVEMLALLGLRYAHLLHARLEGEVRERFAGALRVVHATAIDEVLSRNVTIGRETPRVLARLALDLADPEVPVPAPEPAWHLSRDKALAPLIAIATQNILSPFEIKVSDKTRLEALRDLTAEMGLTSATADKVRTAIEQAQKALQDKGPGDLIRWGAVGAGVIAIVVATGGLALAAAPGVAGAAALTSALAAFGPGGMVGGLVSAGALVSAGGGGIGIGLANPGTSAESVETILVAQVALVTLRKSYDLDGEEHEYPNYGVWRELVETERQVRRERERIDEFSDPSAASLKELDRKIAVVTRALAFLRSIGAEVGVEATPSAGGRRQVLKAPSLPQLASARRQRQEPTDGQDTAPSAEPLASDD